MTLIDVRCQQGRDLIQTRIPEFDSVHRRTLRSIWSSKPANMQHAKAHVAYEAACYASYGICSIVSPKIGADCRRSTQPSSYLQVWCGYLAATECRIPLHAGRKYRFREAARK